MLIPVFIPIFFVQLLSTPVGYSGAPVVVPREEVREVMLREVAREYDATKTTNGARLFAEIVLELGRRAHSEEPDGPPIMIRHDDWFETYLQATGLRAEEATIGQRLAYEHKQDVFVDYNRAGVIESVEVGPEPDFALNVQISWPDVPELPEKYSYDDTTATPRLQVTNHRVIRFRLLDFGDMILYDEIEGVTGRPASGILGALFKLIGEGHLKWSRITITENGLQIGRAQAKKGFFSVTETVTVYPDGRAEKGLPEDMRELTVVEERLKQKIEIEYVDWGPEWATISDAVAE